MAMISQVNYYAPRLHLPVAVPVMENKIQYLHVSVPFLEKEFRSNGGRIQAENYSFTFDDRLDSISKLADDGYESFGIPMESGETAKSLMERASRMKYTVSTNDIYRMATNWLEAMDIDLVKLEQANPPCVNKYPVFQSERGPVPNPSLVVDWRNPKKPGFDTTAATVKISAVSGDLLQIEIGQGSFFRQPPIVRDLDKLLAISDEEFAKYSTLERSNLLVQFAGLHCSDLHCPGVDKPISLSQTNSPTTNNASTKP